MRADSKDYLGFVNTRCKYDTVIKADRKLKRTFDDIHFFNDNVQAVADLKASILTSRTTILDEIDVEKEITLNDLKF